MQEFKIKDCLSLREAAKYLDINERRLKQFTELKLIHSFTIKPDTSSKSINFYHKSELDRFVESIKKECFGE